jgi:hypothetical protein
VPSLVYNTFATAFGLASKGQGLFFNDPNKKIGGVTTGGWICLNQLVTTLADSATIPVVGGVTFVWSGTAAKTELLPAAPFDGMFVRFVNATAATSTILSGNGKNIIIDSPLGLGTAGASAATITVAGLTTVSLVFDDANSLWRQA